MISERTQDRWAIVLFVILPVSLYVPFAFGRTPVMPGDDLTQNYPLRVLAGEIIRSGHLPAWDPFIWSGTPLLAGWNAGAMFPGTWLFAFVPNLVAWTINYIAVPVIGAIGVFVLCRRIGLKPLAAALGALVFNYTGFMSGQVVHIGLTDGTTFMAWMLVGLDGLARETSPRRRLFYGLVLAVAMGLNVLAGDPRAVSSAAILFLLYLFTLVWRKPSEALKLFVRAITAVILGLGLSAVQWLPGIGFLRSSQRASAAYSFFTAGSIGASHLLSLVSVPFLLGANGNWNLQPYQGNYNLPELTVGVGLIGLVALLHYLPEVLGSLQIGIADLIARRRHQRISDHPIGIWYVMVLVGLVATLGGQTPLGHVLVDIPLYSVERLQNRNAVIFDFALAMLVAYFVQEHAGTTRLGRVHPRDFTVRVRSLIELIPSAVVIATVIVTYIDPLRLESSLNVAPLSRTLFNQYDGYLIASLVLAVLLAVFLLVRSHLTTRLCAILLVLFVLIDVSTYVTNGDYLTPANSSALAPNALSDQVGALIGADGRFAIYNPAQYRLGDETALVGLTDLNILQKNPTVQGYGSIVNGIYQNATSTHNVEDLNANALSGVSFDTLDLKSLLTLPSYFGEPLPSNDPVPIGHGQVLGPNGAPYTSSSALGLSAYAPGPTALNSNGQSSYMLPEPSELDHLEVTFLNEATPVPNKVSLEVYDASDHLHTYEVPVLKHSAQLSLHLDVASLLVKNNTTDHGEIAAVVTTSTSGNRFLLDGVLQGRLTYPHWHYSGPVGSLVSFTNTETAGLAWLQPAKDHTPNPRHKTNGNVTVQSSPIDSEVMTVHSPGDAILARSTGFSSGWTAHITPIGGGATRVLRVHRFGLIQSVNMPKGNYVVTWHYASDGVLIGFILSALSSLFVLIMLGALLFRRLRAG